jgi:hypothetical protein
MPHQEKHSKVNAAGEITHVFGHRFVLKTGSKSVLDGLTPRGLEIVGLRFGDRVALEGEQKPAEIKVSKLERSGETFAIADGLHGAREDEADPAIAIKTAEDAGYQVVGGPRRKPKHFEVLGKKGGDLRSFTSSSAEVFGRLSVCPRTITNGNPKWSRHAPRKAHFMNRDR